MEAAGLVESAGAVERVGLGGRDGAGGTPLACMIAQCQSWSGPRAVSSAERKTIVAEGAAEPFK